MATKRSPSRVSSVCHVDFALHTGYAGLGVPKLHIPGTDFDFGLTESHSGLSCRLHFSSTDYYYSCRRLFTCGETVYNGRTGTACPTTLALPTALTPPPRLPRLLPLLLLLYSALELLLVPTLLLLLFVAISLSPFVVVVPLSAHSFLVFFLSVAALWSAFACRSNAGNVVALLLICLVSPGKQVPGTHRSQAGHRAQLHKAAESVAFNTIRNREMNAWHHECCVGTPTP